MTKEDTWQRLSDLKVVKGEMPTDSWNLHGIDLHDVDLQEADLQDVDLTEADLRNADLRNADLSGANLTRVDLRNANLNSAILKQADLYGANLTGANLSSVNFLSADLSDARLRNVNLREAYLSQAILFRADLSGANLFGACLEYSNLVETELSGAILTDCRVYGVSAWGVKLDRVKDQSNLRVTPHKDSGITVDNIEVAQFVYLLLHNEKIRSVIDTIGKKAVLILGRFTPDRKSVLDAIRNKLRQLGFVPMMFDFDRPDERDFTETIKILAGISRFIIADITNPKSSPLELQATVPDYMIPFVPIIQENENPFSMFRDLKNKYPTWVLDPLVYDSPENLIRTMEDSIIKPALKCAEKLISMKANATKMRYVKDY